MKKIFGKKTGLKNRDFRLNVMQKKYSETMLTINRYWEHQMGIHKYQNP